MNETDVSCLSKAQLSAVCHDTGPALVIAGPGSGKTRVITYRIQHLTDDLGVSPEKILVITFTKAAAVQMQERTKNLIGIKAGRVCFGTFHSVFFRILKEEGGYSPSAVIKVNEKKRILRNICESKGIESRDQEDMYRGILADISTYKCNAFNIDFSPKSLGKELFEEIFFLYQKELDDRNMLDFDDLLKKTYLLLRDSEKVRRKWQGRFKYILIDEFQDIDMLQFMTVRLLLSKENNLFVVGDDDQSIYSFRGARPEIMLGFNDVFPQAARIELSVNYRSKSEIVTAAVKLIGKNNNRFDKKITSGREGGGDVDILSFAGRREQADFICEEIKRNEGSVAVLTRTNRGAGFIAEELSARNITFDIKDASGSIFDHFIAQDIAAYIRLSLGDRRRSTLFRVMNKPDRGISRQGIAGCEADIRSVDKRLADNIARLSHLPPYAALSYIYNVIGYSNYLKAHAKEYGAAFDELQEVFFDIQEAASKYMGLKEFLERLEFSDEKQNEHFGSKRDTRVHIMTAHASKGLEYDCVYIIDVSEGIFPYKNASSDEAIEEERRLFYVAMTRAVNRLIICQVKRIRERDTVPSRFVKEIEDTKD